MMKHYQDLFAAHEKENQKRQRSKKKYNMKEELLEKHHRIS
jgi:hypothetical protein